MGRDQGLSARDVGELAHHRESDAFSELEKNALDYALCLTETPADVPDALFEALRAELDDAQMMELTATAAFENYLARFNRGFAIEAQGFSKGGVCQIPDHVRERMEQAAREAEAGEVSSEVAPHLADR